MPGILAEASVITTKIGEIVPAITTGFADIVTGCIDLAIALVPLALGFLGVTMVIKQGKKLMKL